MIMITGIFAIGIALGALYATRSRPEVLYDYFADMPGGDISIKIGTVILGAVVVWAMLFFSAFFKFGVQSASLFVGLRGFLDGFAVLSILRILGFRGLGLCFFDVFTAPLLILMAFFAIGYLKNDIKSGGEYLIKSVIALALIIVFSYLSAIVSGAITPDLIKKLI
ncbi:MAG: hypothetical protein Q4B31_03565 [Clostridia bacterium]|nr:hypothetical protein [Clostridia bacterium]